MWTLTKILTALQKTEDAAHATGDKGMMLLAVRKDTATALAGTDADYIPLIVDANGRLHVLDQNSAAMKTALELIDNAISGSEMQVDVVAALPAGTNAIGKLAANAGVNIGDVGVVEAASPATVNKTTTAAQDIVAAPGAGHHLRVKAFSLSNDGTADNEVSLRDATTERLKYNVPKDGGTIVVNLVGAHWDLAANQALTATCEVAGDMHINVHYEDITD